MGKINMLDVRKHLMDHCDFSEFTRNDWRGYCGSDKFDDGSEPIIKHCDKFDIICDKNGMSIESEQESIALQVEMFVW